MSIVFKRRDIRYLTFYLKDPDVNGTENSFNISGSTTINFNAQKSGESTICLTGTCEIMDGTNGVCRYLLTGSSLAVGYYTYEVEVHLSSGEIASTKSKPLQITSDLPQE